MKRREDALATLEPSEGLAYGKGCFHMHHDDTVFGTVRNGVLTLSGYGCRLSVDGGALRVQDGVAGNRCDIRFHRATCGIKRVTIIGHEGELSLGAVRWLHGIGAAISQIDRDGTVLLTSAPLGTDKPAVRRAQALAATNATGLTITREIMRVKIAGQAGVLSAMGEMDAADALNSIHAQLEDADTQRVMRSLEAHAAQIYWRCWEPIEIGFARRDSDGIPPHWRTFGTRSSPITASPRRAATPGHALLNYLYAILETESRIAALAIGLDPGIGVLHADQPSRDSMALDLMEAVRPIVDHWLFDWSTTARFAKRDFVETSDGTVRVVRPVTVHLSSTASQWATAIGPITERVARMLAGARTPIATPLTEARRSAGRERVGQVQPTTASIPDQTSNAPNAHASFNRIAKTKQPRTCPECGRMLEDRRRRYCSDICKNAHYKAVSVPAFAATGPAALAERRNAGKDPAHGGSAALKRSASNAQRALERRAWDEAHGDGQAERERFVREVLLTLAEVPLSRIVEATGFSLRYASLIRQGKSLPHPVHYANLERVAQDKRAEDG